MRIGNGRVRRACLLVLVTGLLALAAAMLPGAASPASATVTCSAGSYFNGSACVPASPGYYVPSSGATSETACPAGTYQPNSGAASCINADPGHYVPSSGQASQTACPAGTYQPNSGAASCIAASVDHYVPGSASTAQLPCPAGTYQPLTGQSSCISVPCPQGTKANFRWHYSANGSAGSWSATRTQTCSGTFSMGPQAMEGNLKVAPGATLRTGYDFTLPGNHNSLTMTVSAAQVTFAVSCVSGAAPSASTLTVTMSAQTYQVTGDQWYPSGDQSSPLVYQGSVTVPDVCGGGALDLAAGGTFSATLG